MSPRRIAAPRWSTDTDTRMQRAAIWILDRIPVAIGVLWAIPTTLTAVVMLLERAQGLALFDPSLGHDPALAELSANGLVVIYFSAQSLLVGANGRSIGEWLAGYAARGRHRASFLAMIMIGAAPYFIQPGAIEGFILTLAIGWTLLLISCLTKVEKEAGTLDTSPEGGQND